MGERKAAVGAGAAGERKIQIITENDDFAAINKPASLLVHETGKAWSCQDEAETVVSWLVGRYPAARRVGDRPDLRPGIVHRLDKDTSGVMVVAKTQAFFEWFKELMKERRVKKTYLAIVRGEVTKAIAINKPIGLVAGGVRRSTRARNMRMVKEAETDVFPVKVIRRWGETLSLVRVVPKTGRTHQIRVHLASIGRPILGDRLYGGEGGLLVVPRQLLHAESLEFSLAEGKRIKVEAEMPEDMRRVLRGAV